MNYQDLHYQFPAKPFQRWHLIEDKSVPRGLRFRHPRQPGEKYDPKVNFGVEELSARLEHAGVEYMRIALGNDASSYDRAHMLLTDGLKDDGPGDGHSPRQQPVASRLVRSSGEWSGLWFSSSTSWVNCLESITHKYQGRPSCGLRATRLLL